MNELKVEQWREMNSAPRNGDTILYLTRYGSIGFCHWSEADGVNDEDLWYDDHEADEVCPVRWLPRDVLPPFPHYY